MEVARDYGSAPEVVPPSNLEYVPYVDQKQYNDQKQYLESEAPRSSSASAPAQKICGLSRRTFWIVVIAVVVILAAAIGGGVGGGLASKRQAIHPMASSYLLRLLWLLCEVA